MNHVWESSYVNDSLQDAVDVVDVDISYLTGIGFFAGGRLVMFGSVYDSYITVNSVIGHLETVW